MLIHVTLVFAVCGLILFALASQPKPAEVGRVMFAFGLLAWLLGKGYMFIPWLK